MTFEEYWAEVGKLNALPELAIKQISSSLSAEAKTRLMKLKTEETVIILKAAIEQVNRGSVESVDSLVKRQM